MAARKPTGPGAGDALLEAGMEVGRNGERRGVAALILPRGGSRGSPLKNIKVLAGCPSWAGC